MVVEVSKTLEKEKSFNFWLSGKLCNVIGNGLIVDKLNCPNSLSEVIVSNCSVFSVSKEFVEKIVVLEEIFVVAVSVTVWITLFDNVSLNKSDCESLLAADTLSFWEGSLNVVFEVVSVEEIGAAVSVTVFDTLCNNFSINRSDCETADIGVVRLVESIAGLEVVLLRWGRLVDFEVDVFSETSKVVVVAKIGEAEVVKESWNKIHLFYFKVTSKPFVK